MRPKPLTNEAEATAKLFEPKWRRLCDLPRGTVSSPIALERMPTVCLSKVAGDMLERNELATACLKNSENPKKHKTAIALLLVMMMVMMMMNCVLSIWSLVLTSAVPRNLRARVARGARRHS